MSLTSVSRAAGEALVPIACRACGLQRRRCGLSCVGEALRALVGRVGLGQGVHPGPWGAECPFSGVRGRNSKQRIRRSLAEYVLFPSTSTWSPSYLWKGTKDLRGHL